MGRLSFKMRKLMELKNFSPHTVSSYLLQTKLFIEHIDILPENISENAVIDYLYYLRKEKNVSTSTIHVVYSALKFFCISVLEKEIDFQQVPFPKKEKRLPVVLASQEIKSILEVTENQKHKSIIMTAYSSGLRLSEIRHIKLHDIDSKRMQIRVQQGKGKKDRYALLPPSLLKQLRLYYGIYKPSLWLFPGKEQNKPLCSMSIQRMFNKVKKKPALLNQPPFIPCGTALPRIFWNPALTW